MSSACSDFLDTSLDRNQTEETIATNRGTIWAFGNAFYSPLGYGYSVIDNNIFATASDEAQQTLASSNVSYFNKGMINENVNPLFTYYRNYYEGIRAANFFLDYVADGKGEALLAENRNLVTDATNYKRDLESLAWYKAEAHVAKAYYYAELIKMYGGVPIIESAVDNGEMVKRASYEEVVEYIVKEIDDHKSALALNWNDYLDREGRFHSKNETSVSWGRGFELYREGFRRPDAVCVSEAGQDHLVGIADAGQSITAVFVNLIGNYILIFGHFGAPKLLGRANFADSERTPWHDIATHGYYVLFAGGLGGRYQEEAGWHRGGDAELHGYGSDDYLSNCIIGGLPAKVIKRGIEWTAQRIPVGTVTRDFHA